MSGNQPGMEGGGVMDQMVPIDGSWETQQTPENSPQVAQAQTDEITKQDEISMEARAAEMEADKHFHDEARQDRLEAENSPIAENFVPERDSSWADEDVSAAEMDQFYEDQHGSENANDMAHVNEAQNEQDLGHEQ